MKARMALDRPGKRHWRPVPGHAEYEVSDHGEIRGAKSKHLLNRKHQAAIWRKLLVERGAVSAQVP
jgi:hypothetical protein